MDLFDQDANLGGLRQDAQMDLKERVDDAVELSNNRMPIDVVVYNKEAYEFARDYLKKKRKAKAVSIKLDEGKPPKGVVPPELS